MRVLRQRSVLCLATCHHATDRLDDRPAEAGNTPLKRRHGAYIAAPRRVLPGLPARENGAAARSQRPSLGGTTQKVRVFFATERPRWVFTHKAVVESRLTAKRSCAGGSGDFGTEKRQIEVLMLAFVGQLSGRSGVFARRRFAIWRFARLHDAADSRNIASRTWGGQRKRLGAEHSDRVQVTSSTMSRLRRIGGSACDFVRIHCR